MMIGTLQEREVALPHREHDATFFHLRTPLLPFEDYVRFAADCAASAAANGGDVDAALFDVVLDRFTAPLMQEALWLASPDLAVEVRAAIRKRPPSAGQPLTRDERRMAYALHRYLSRCTTRPTPFGLFAGCSVGDIGKETNLVIGPIHLARRHVEVDSEVMMRAAARWARDAQIYRGAKLVTSPTLYRDGDAYRYITYEDKGRRRTFSLRKVMRDEVVDAVRERCAAGASFEELVRSIAEAIPDAAAEEIEAYIDDLVRSGILLLDFLPAITGEPFDAMTKIARHAGADGEMILTFRSHAEWLSAQPPGIGCEAYEAFSSVATAEIKPAKAPLFRADLIKSGRATLGSAFVDQVYDALRVLSRLPQPKDAGMEHLRARFEERYGRRLVPLMEVADEESGILTSYAAGVDLHAEELLGGITLGGGAEGGATLSAWEIHLLRRIATLDGHELVIGESDLSRFATESDALGLSLAAIVRLLEPLDGEGRCRFYLQTAGGSSGINMLTRFCAADPDLEGRVLDFSRKEAASDREAVIAEVVHLPNARSLNVVGRPSLRDYEIPLTSASSMPRERQLLPSELHIGVGRDGFYLWSDRLQKRVIPRLTTAHAYASAGQLRLYKFLASLQDQGNRLTWSWGALDSMPRLPRVRIGDAVVSPARWLLRASELASSREDLGLPRWVTVTEGDNELLLDLESEIGMRSLRDAAAGKEHVEVHESLPLPESLHARGPEGTFFHEIVIPFVARSAKTVSAHVTRTRQAASQHPGSACAYVKLYVAPSFADDLLLDRIAPTVEALRMSGVVDRFFFIRYGDPDWHLRVRLFVSDERRAFDAARALLDSVRPEIADGRVWKTQIDTYEPEIERYGGVEIFPGIETWFGVDSDAALATLTELRAASLLPQRWKAALVSMHAILDGAAVSLDDRIALFARLEQALLAEHGGRRESREAILNRLRREKRELETLLFSTGRDTIWGRIAARCASGAATLQNVKPLLGDLLHMNANRILRHDARAQELVLYSFLNRLYASAKARRKGRP